MISIHKTRAKFLSMYKAIQFQWNQEKLSCTGEISLLHIAWTVFPDWENDLFLYRDIRCLHMFSAVAGESNQTEAPPLYRCYP